MKKLLLKFSIIALASQSYYAGCYAMDLNEALTQAYKNNIQLQGKREEYLRSIEAYPAALADFMPQISSTLTFKKAIQKAEDGLVSSITPQKGNVKTIDQQINVNQNLFNGGGSVAALKAAKLTYFQAKYQLENDEQDIFLKVIQTYLDLIKAQESYDISDKSLKYLIRQYDSTQQKFKLGESTKTEVAQAKAALAKYQASKVTAYANLQGQRATFKNIIGVEPTTNVKFPNVETGLPKDFNNLLDASTNNNPNVAAQKLGIQISNYDTYRAKSKLLPSASLGLSIDNSKTRTRYKGSAPYAAKDNFSRTGAITVNIPILAQGGAEYSKIRQQKSKARSAALSFNDSVSVITANCAAGWENYVATKESLHLFKDQVAAAAIALEGVKQEEALGTKTVLDVLNAQNDLYSAQLGNISAKRDYFYSTYNIKSLMGKLTANHMKLKVDQFDADKEFKKVKHKLIGY